MPLEPAIALQIRDAVASGFAAQVAMLEDVVRMPSTRGNEHTVQDYLARAITVRGLALDRFGMDATRLNAHPGAGVMSDTHSEAPIVVGIHRPRHETGRSLILQGHVDVVPTEPSDQWAAPPFDPVIADGWMNGRGAGDMKAGTVSLFAALDAIRATGHQPAATLYLQSVVEEESTGNGALMTHLRGYKADAALVPEPTHEHLTRANVGVIWFQIEVRGHPVHVASMGEGANAIDAAFRVASALRTLESRWNEARANNRWFADHAKPVNLNLGRIEGGDWASSVPAWCRIDCRISVLPGQSARAALDEITACVAEFARDDPFLSNSPPEVHFNGFIADGYALEPGSDAEAVLAGAHKTVNGSALTSDVATAYLDSRVYALLDNIPALNYGCIAENIHGYDERVDLASVQRTTEVIALFIAEWCGLEPVSEQI